MIQLNKTGKELETFLAISSRSTLLLLHPDHTFCICPTVSVSLTRKREIEIKTMMFNIGTWLHRSWKS
jgi:hypothetical protein